MVCQYSRKKWVLHENMPVFETVARLQSMLLGREPSFAAKSQQSPSLTFESATMWGRRLWSANSGLA